MRLAYALGTTAGLLLLVSAIGLYTQTDAPLSSVVDIGPFPTSTVRMVPGDGSCVTLGSLASSTATILCGGTKAQLETLLNEHVSRERLLGSSDALDARARKLAQAIGQKETGHRNVPGQTGELPTRYQFMPATWASLAKKYLGDAKAPTTDANQDKVAFLRIRDLLKAGHSEKEVAMIWNGGKPYRKVGTVKTKAGKTIRYDTAAYASDVLALYEWR